MKTERPEVSEISALQVLRRVWNEQFEPVALGAAPVTLATLRPGAATGREFPISQRIESPYDPDARYRTRRSTRWTGYVVHLTETCDAEQPRMITHVHTTSADVHELACTDTIHDALAAKTLVPAVHLVDTAHVDARQFAEATRRGIDLVGPY